MGQERGGIPPGLGRKFMNKGGKKKWEKDKEELPLDKGAGL